ncbi:elongation of very long chain fatty acids protein 6-like [Bombus huntii]|uniref:elongation of very long chain fatty acids protein 6-like n=1 Tax=Bombus huntii TaxID=85661 RepID=UPI0021A9A39F|nr:elongation of very long chain fatty acids protein 6-like [Bombus huntii]
MDKLDYMSITIPNYPYTFNFENSLAYSDTVIRITNHYPYCFCYCFFYVVLIFAGKYFMSSRPKFELRGMLVLWNASLAMFSIFGFLRMGSELYHVLSHYGFQHSICISYMTYDPVMAFWSLLFILSKIVEFGDTAFIVLRKQPLQFLHWYHHITVLLYAWLCFIEDAPHSRWHCVINYFVHSWMYSYYALKAMRFSLPRWFAMSITMLQTLQMVWGCFTAIMAYNYITNNQIDCHVKSHNAKICLLLYFSYFVLFSRFFKQAYLSNNCRKIKESSKHAQD